MRCLLSVEYTAQSLRQGNEKPALRLRTGLSAVPPLLARNGGPTYWQVLNTAGRGNGRQPRSRLLHSPLAGCGSGDGSGAISRFDAAIRLAPSRNRYAARFEPGSVSVTAGYSSFGTP